jgi:hypothetical protein
LRGAALCISQRKLMFIVMRDGPKKGQMQEVKFHIGQELILAGRADLYDLTAKTVIITKVTPAADKPININMPMPQGKKKKR